MYINISRPIIGMLQVNAILQPGGPLYARSLGTRLRRMFFFF